MPKQQQLAVVTAVPEGKLSASLGNKWPMRNFSAESLIVATKKTRNEQKSKRAAFLFSFLLDFFSLLLLFFVGLFPLSLERQT